MQSSKVTLTFDNGPEPKVTPAVLDCLAHHGVSASFFVMGRKAATPGGALLVRRASECGHRIGNHTYSHATPLGELDRATALADFEKAEDALSWLDQSQRYFRPYGRAGKLGRHLLHPAVVEKLLGGGYTCVLWNSVPGDWRDPDGWVDRAIADCRTRPWSLVVLHDTPTGAMAHLDEFLSRLKEEGMEITQDYPTECTPILNGQIVRPIEPYVAEDAAA
jgi:peptidoglycan/xylan/chitin deacetylase (PgdA/CDA1 family)